MLTDIGRTIGELETDISYWESELKIASSQREFAVLRILSNQYSAQARFYKAHIGNSKDDEKKIAEQAIKGYEKAIFCLEKTVLEDDELENKSTLHKACAMLYKKYFLDYESSLRHLQKALMTLLEVDKKSSEVWWGVIFICSNIRASCLELNNWPRAKLAANGVISFLVHYAQKMALACQALPADYYIALAVCKNFLYMCEKRQKQPIIEGKTNNISMAQNFKPFLNAP